jgi:hypothetical protein
MDRESTPNSAVAAEPATGLRLPLVWLIVNWEMFEEK